MIALEAALSVFLLCGAGLVAQNLWTLISTPTGFDPDHVLAMQLKLPSSHSQDSIDPKAGQAFQEYLEKIAAIPVWIRPLTLQAHHCAPLAPAIPHWST